MVDIVEECEERGGDGIFPAVIASYCSWHVQIPMGVLHEPGRIFCGGTPPGFEGVCHKMLQPIQVAVLRQSPRDDISERTALLHFTRTAVARCGTDRLDLCVGCLQLYLTHWPSLCGVVVFAEFVRHFPAVRLELHYDNAYDPVSSQ
eukprot:NODE_19785_length_827_cov_5.354286.p1 GENE.NODE_19785_length_827_cov_5.354286~~NODE_19785_length_827_cov_5.354286.p1  ORF type:complete len:147 (-),score=30.69 NODE_19785_length_827_cov_5.354286:250-690(-)